MRHSLRLRSPNCGGLPNSYPSHGPGHCVFGRPRVRVRRRSGLGCFGCIRLRATARSCRQGCGGAFRPPLRAVPFGLYGAGALRHSLGWREPQLRRPTRPNPSHAPGHCVFGRPRVRVRRRSGLGYFGCIRLRATARFCRLGRGCASRLPSPAAGSSWVSMGKEWAFTALSQVGAGFGAGAAATSCSLETNVAFPGPDAASGERRRRKGGPNALGMALMLVHREAQRRFVGVVALELLVELKGVVGVGLAADRGRPMQRLRQV